MADKPATSKHRNAKVGQVISRSGNKTIVVKVTRQMQHPLYKRFIRKSKKFYAHDELNACQVGDSVRIVETRPISALKRWRLAEIVRRSNAILPEAGKAQESAS